MSSTLAQRLTSKQDGYGIHCPSCNSNNLKTIETRAEEGAIKRRRVCECGYRFNTEERVKCQ